MTARRFELPARNALFYNRVSEHDRLSEILLSDSEPGLHAAAISGLGGVGKTQLALEFAHRSAEQFDVVWWLPAETTVGLSGGLRRLARRLNVPEVVEHDSLVSMLWEALEQNGSWLLVYDNAPDLASIQTSWPSATNGRVLVTSRYPDWREVANVVEIDVFSHRDAVNFLLDYTSSSEVKAASDLTEALGDLPLAIAQAGAYIDQTQITIDEYLRLYGTHSEDLLYSGDSVGSHQAVGATWSVALDRMQQETPAARDLIVLFSFLAPDEIPRTLARSSVVDLPPRLANLAEDDFAYNDALRALRRYSLVSVSPKAITIHRLVQTVVRQQLRLNEEQLWASTAAKLINTAIPNFASDADSWVVSVTDVRLLLTHAIAVLDHTTSLGVSTADVADLSGKAAMYLLADGDLLAARRLQEESVRCYRKITGPASPEYARVVNNLGAVMREYGEIQTSIRLHSEALQIFLDLGEEEYSTSIADSFSYLALVARRDSKPERARDLYSQAISYRGLAAGDQMNIGGAQELSSIGVVMKDLGEFDEAEHALRTAVGTLTEILGDDHVRVATAQDNLAQLLSDRADYHEALELFLTARRIFERHLGRRHPEVAWSWFHIAVLRYRQAEYRMAEEAIRECLGIRLKLFIAHPEAVSALRVQSDILRALGSDQDAELASDTADQMVQTIAAAEAHE